MPSSSSYVESQAIWLQLPGSEEMLEISGRYLGTGDYLLVDVFLCFSKSLLQVMMGGKYAMGFAGTISKQLHCSFLKNKSGWNYS